MTNRELLNTLSTKDFVKELRQLKSHPFVKYIDFERYFDNEDPDISHFLNIIGTCTVKPTEAEIESFKNETLMSTKINDIAIRNSFAKIQNYINEHTFENCPVFDIRSIFGQEYYEVGYPDNTIRKIPALFVSDFVESKSD